MILADTYSAFSFAIKKDPTELVGPSVESIRLGLEGGAGCE